LAQFADGPVERRIAVLILLQLALDRNYEAVKSAAVPLQ
jgi:hypothetical protein